MTQTSTSRRALVLVAHPHDETARFSSVLGGAHLVAVTDHGAPPGALEAAGTALGATRVTRLRLPAIAGWRLPHAQLRARLAALRDELGPGLRVYTHDPLDTNRHHQDVVLAAAEVFGEVWVPASACPVEEVHLLDAAAFSAKLSLLNTSYGPHLPHPSHPDDRRDHPVCELSARDVTPIEAFSRARADEVARALSLTHYDLVLSQTPDTWAFETSPYEAERLAATAELLAVADRLAAPRTVLELGACEGAMTARIRAALPAASLRALEPDPAFATRLEARFAEDPAVEVVRRSLHEVELEADLVVAAEVLYYVASTVQDVVERLRAGQLLTSSHGAFDERLAELLGHAGYREVAARRLAVRFERAGGERAPFLVRRVGAMVRLWRGPTARG